MTIEDTRCFCCPIRNSCETYKFFTQRMHEMTSDIIALHLRLGDAL